jgi:chromosome partitioning protein
MTMIVTIANQKGGVGKTDVTVNLASCLAKMGKKVLIIDMDPQANATDYVLKKKTKASISDVLINSVGIDSIITNTRVENLSVAPGSAKLHGAQIHLMNDIGMQFKLRRKLKTMRKRFDYIFIDTPPSLGPLTINALTASDCVLVPVQTAYFATDGVEKLNNTIKSIKAELNPKLKVRGYVITMFDKRNGLSFKNERNIRGLYGDKVFRTHIPVNVDLADAPSYHKPVILHSSKSRGAYAYSNLAKEFLGLL